MGREWRQETFMDDFGLTISCENNAREPDTIDQKTIIKTMLTDREI
jgi:hypothetical protein